MYRRTTFRGFEAILAIIGGLIAFLGSSFVIFIGSLTTALPFALGVISIIGSILAIFSGWFSFRNSEAAGVLLVIASILVLIGSSIFGVIGAILILIAGISDLFRK